MSRLVAWVESLASSLGGAGLFVVAFLDSSFISLPEINDVLVVMLVTQNKPLMPYYAAMATAGSVAGCLLLHTIGRLGGEAMLRRRIAGPHLERAMRLFERFGVLALVVPALLPPPAPFKAFVLLSGVAGLRRSTFALAVTVGRGIRYFGEGVIAVRYGDQAIDFLHANEAVVVAVLLGGVVACLAGYALYRWRRRQPASGGL